MRRARNGAGTTRQHKRGGWICTVSIDGRRYSFYGRTEADAVHKMEQAKADLSAGRPIDRTSRLRDVVARWLAEVQARREPATFGGYERVCRLHLLPALGQRRLCDLAPDHVARWLTAMERAGASPRSRQERHAVLRMALNFAMRWQVVGRNVATLVPAPTPPKNKPQHVSADRATGLLDAFAGDRLEALFCVLLGSALRVSEALALRWSDVDLDAGHLTVYQSLTRANGHHVMKPAKTALSHRTVGLPSWAVAALRRHRVQQAEQRLATPGWTDQGLVFTNRTGGPQHRNTANDRLTALLQRAGLPHCSPHTLRHQAASLLLAGGVDLFTVSRTLGHSNVGTTANVYGHLTDQGRKRATDAMEGLRKKGAR